MSNLPELASSPGGLEVDHSISAPSPNYTAQHQYVNQPLPHKVDYNSSGNGDRGALQDTPRICGVRRPTFWLAVILAIVVIAAAVGGGVGGSIAVSNARSNAQSTAQTSAKETSTSPNPSASADRSNLTTASDSAPTPTPTAPYVPKLPSDVPSINITCPSQVVESTELSKSRTERYKCQQGKDYINNDIMWFTAYTLQSCLYACTAYNAGNHTDKPCKGISLAQDMSNKVNINGGANCWLKSEVDEAHLSDSDLVTLAWL